MNVKIKTGFTKYRDSDLLVKAQKIHDDMDADMVDYPTPLPSLASGQTKINAYGKALSNLGSPAKTVTKNQKRQALIDYLNLLALYVQQNCNNDAAIALLSGYDIWKTKSPVGDLSKPKGFTLVAGDNSGEIYVSMDSYGPIANSYVYRYSQEEGSDPETWKTVVSSSPRLLISGLQSGKKVFVRGAGVGASKHLVWSNTISMFVM